MRPEPARDRHRARASLGHAGLNLVLVVVSVGLAVLLVEGYARLAGLYVDEDLSRIRGEERRHWLKEPVLGWRGMPGASYVLAGTRVRTVVRNNTLGFRDREFAFEKRRDETRIAVLGDSFIWGYGTELASRRFTDLLEAKLRAAGTQAEVYNFGIAGWGTDQEYLAYQHVVSLYRPDLVILAYYLNDPLDNVTPEGKPYYVWSAGALHLKNVPVQRGPGGEAYTPSFMVRLKTTLVRRLYTYRLLRDGLKAWDPLYQALVRAGLLDDQLRGHSAEYLEGLTRELIMRLRHAVEADGAKFMVLWIPDVHEVRASWFSPVTRTLVSVKTKLAQSDLGCPQLDLAPAFAAAMQASERSFYQAFDGNHWNDDGNRLVADVVTSFLQTRGLLPYAR